MLAEEIISGMYCLRQALKHSGVRPSCNVGRWTQDDTLGTALSLQVPVLRQNSKRHSGPASFSPCSEALERWQGFLAEALPAALRWAVLQALYRLHKPTKDVDLAAHWCDWLRTPVRKVASWCQEAAENAPTAVSKALTLAAEYLRGNKTPIAFLRGVTNLLPKLAFSAPDAIGTAQPAADYLQQLARDLRRAKTPREAVSAIETAMYQVPPYSPARNAMARDIGLCLRAYNNGIGNRPESKGGSI